MPLTPPTAFPAPGTYAVAQRIALIATPGAIIHIKFRYRRYKNNTPVGLRQ